MSWLLAPAGAVASLNDVGDVVVSSITDNEILQWDTGTSKWINQTLAEAGISAVGHGHVAADVSDFDAEVSNNADVAANTAKVSNATHTGDVTGSGALTIDPTGISGKTLVTAVAGDMVLLWDATDSSIKRANANDFLGGGVSYPLTPQDNEKIQFGTGTDFEEYYDGADMVYDSLVAGETVSWKEVGVEKMELDHTLNYLRLHDGYALRLSDSTDADYSNWFHNGTSLAISHFQTANWEITNLTGGINIRDGAWLAIKDSTDADSITISHDGVDVNVAFVGTGIFKMRDGIDFRVYDSTDVDYLSILHNGTNAIIETTAATGGSIVLGHQGVSVLQTKSHSASGQSTGAEVKRHDGNFFDIGMNVLPDFNFNASDTLEAQHVGCVTGKDNTTTTYVLTGPTSADVDFQVEGVCHVANLGASGNYTLNDTVSCTMYYMDGTAAPVDIAGAGTLAPGGFITLWRYSTTAIYIFGLGFTP